MSRPQNEHEDEHKRVSRRTFLSMTGGVVGGAALGLAGGTEAAIGKISPAPVIAEPFWGRHQSGIVTPSQKHTYFAAFDVTTGKKEDVIALLRTWTAAAARLTQGQTAESASTQSAYASSSDPALPPGSSTPSGDSGEADGLMPERLTLTFGFGPSLFGTEGNDRFRLAAFRPAALADLPRFSGDELVEAQTGGDLSVQACADDPQVAFHAVRQLARLAYDSAQIRWTQTGFLPKSGAGQTHRNLMGFKDGSSNISPRSEPDLDEYVWAGSEGPAWMQNGSYLVVRRIRIALEHWDRMSLAFQEQAVGRHKHTGAPLGGHSEFETINLDAKDADGNPVIAQNAHVRLAAAASNNGAQILRRPYSYNDGVSLTSERWPPWRQGMEFDAGLLFLCYQQDPRTGFIPLFDTMSKIDMLNQFVTHVGGGLFACPGGVQKGEYIGQKLFETT